MAYSDIEATEALIKLAINKGDYEKTAEDTGVSARTIKRWAKMSPKKAVPELLERAIERLLMVIPEKMTSHDWAVSLGILMDKWLLVQGMPTQRTENIDKQIDDLKDDEYERVLAEAETIIREAQSGVSYSGNGSKPS